MTQFFKKKNYYWSLGRTTFCATGTKVFWQYSDCGAAAPEPPFCPTWPAFGIPWLEPGTACCCWSVTMLDGVANIGNWGAWWAVGSGNIGWPLLDEFWRTGGIKFGFWGWKLLYCWLFIYFFWKMIFFYRINCLSSNIL